MRRGLGGFEGAGEIVFLEKLPKGISGKIQRSTLKQLQLAAA
jgi:acyl-coenzyme A synthetase/AMP-(fatty) acid ligase